jgi:TnsA endonuclease N terminal
MRQSIQGIFRPANPQKYIGDASNIVWRSTWERKFMRYCDNTKAVLRWSSEEVIVPYVSPIDLRFHRYFPDFFIEVQASTGVVHYLIEIKPERYTRMPVKKKRSSKRYLSEVAEVAKNHAKWQAAEMYCKERNWKFMVLTEHHLGLG